jgi:Glycogen recognition site of AMP-activated protein kinase
MNRSSWGGIMFLSLAVTGGSAYYVLTSLEAKQTTMVPLQQIKKEEIPVAPQQNEVKETLNVSTPVVTENPPVSVEDGKSKDTPEPSNLRKILFKYKNLKAKEVYLTGTFNKWSRDAMVNEKGLWQLTKELAPGSYEYRFIVGDNRIRDPNNRLWAKNGNSMLKVKSNTSK